MTNKFNFKITFGGKIGEAIILNATSAGAKFGLAYIFPWWSIDLNFGLRF